MARRTVVGAAVLEVSYQFLFLGVDRNHWLTLGLQGKYLTVDVLELGVAVDVVTTSVGLAVALPAVTQLTQQLGHRRRSNLMAHLAQRHRQLRQTLRYPQQRLHRVTQRHRREHVPQVVQQRRVLCGQGTPTTASMTHPPCWQRWSIQILQAPTNGAAGDAGGLCHSHQAATPQRTNLRRRE